MNYEIYIGVVHVQATMTVFLFIGVISIHEVMG